MPELMPEFRKVARVLIHAGIGIERNRVVNLIQGPILSTTARTRTAPAMRPSTGAVYGAVSQPVREALKELSADTPAGVAAADIVAHFELQGATGPTERQVRAALKNLYRVGHAERLERGRYLHRESAGSSATDGNPDAGASGQLPLAAE